MQIPRGAIPVLGGKYTQSVSVDLEPYHTQTQEFYFYFPAAGDLEQFPVHVSRNDQVVAHACALPFSRGR